MGYQTVTHMIYIFIYYGTISIQGKPIKYEVYHFQHQLYLIVIRLAVVAMFKNIH